MVRRSGGFSWEESISAVQELGWQRVVLGEVGRRIWLNIPVFHDVEVVVVVIEVIWRSILDRRPPDKCTVVPDISLWVEDQCLLAEGVPVP